MKGSCGGKKMVERHSDPLWEGQAELLCSLGRSQEYVLCCSWPQSGESQLWRLRAPDLPLITQEAYMRERKGGKAKAGCWFLKQPEALAPPSPSRWVAPL